MTLEIATSITSWLEAVNPVSWITLEEVKRHLNVQDTDDDSLIESYIDASVDFVADATGRDLNDHFEYLTYEVDVRHMKNVLYVFDGLSVTASIVKKHEELEKGMTDFDNQTTVSHTYNNSKGKVKSIFVSPTLTDLSYITIKNTIEWTPGQIPVLKALITTIAAEYYRNRELTMRSSQVNKTAYAVLNSFRKQ